MNRRPRVRPAASFSRAKVEVPTLVWCDGSYEKPSHESVDVCLCPSCGGLVKLRTDGRVPRHVARTAPIDPARLH